MTNAPDTKTCPVCGKEFTRAEKKLTRNQWFLRIFCSNKCRTKSRFKKDSFRFGDG